MGGGAAATTAAAPKVEGNELNELEASSDAAEVDGSETVAESIWSDRAAEGGVSVGRADPQPESVAAAINLFDLASSSCCNSLSHAAFSDSSDRYSRPVSPPSSSSAAPAQCDPAPPAHSPSCPRCRCLHGCDSNAALAHRLRLVMTRFNRQMVRAEEEDEDE